MITRELKPCCQGGNTVCAIVGLLSSQSSRKGEGAGYMGHGKYHYLLSPPCLDFIDDGCCLLYVILSETATFMN